MVRLWTKLLPFFIVEWLALKHCERFNYDLGKYGNVSLVSPYPKILFIRGTNER